VIAIERKKFVFKTKEIWFADHAYDVEGVATVAFPLCKNAEQVPGFICIKRVNSCIDLMQDVATLWSKMDRKSCRYAIRRAEREGVYIKINENYDEFYELYRSFLRSKNLMGALEDLATIRKYGTLFTAEHNEELLGGHVYLEDDNAMSYWIAANQRFDSTYAQKKTLIGNASHLIQWEAIKYAKRRGLAEFDMGGLIAGDYGRSINAFKKKFGGKTETRYDYYKDYLLIFLLIRKIYFLRKKMFELRKKILAKKRRRVRLLD
jgi:lipid II:glycine glycyltransferase (peptidoglycan interpeptide bridge formation enzyme)